VRVRTQTGGPAPFAVQALQGELVIHNRDDDVSDIRGGPFLHNDDIVRRDRMAAGVVTVL